MAKSFKEDYGSITLRLRCREALNQPDPWTWQELNNSFRNAYSKTKIEKFIEEINLMDEFLEVTLNPKDYPLVESKDKGNGVQIFTDLLDLLKWEKKQGRSDTEIEKIKQCGFSLIHNAKSTYKDSRKFRDALKMQHRELITWRIIQFIPILHK